MTTTTAARPIESAVFAYARGCETVYRFDGESVDDFAFRACRESNWAQRIVLADAKGGIVAVSHGGGSPRGV